MTTGNTRTSDMGGGLYIKEANRWILAGIMSKINSNLLTEDPTPSQVFTFTNFPKYVSWLENLEKNLKNQDEELDDYRSLSSIPNWRI